MKVIQGENLKAENGVLGNFKTGSRDFESKTERKSVAEELEEAVLRLRGV